MMTVNPLTPTQGYITEKKVGMFRRVKLKSYA